VVTATPTPTPSPSATATAAPPAPQAATAAAAARVAAASRSVSPPSIANGSTGQDTAESDAARPEPLPAPSSGAKEPGSDERRFGLSAARVGMIVGGAVTAVVVAGVLMLVLTGNDATPPPPNDFGNTPSTGEPASSGQAPGNADSGGSSASSSLTSADRRATNVAVLNGTTQPGLARSVGDKIEKDGFTIGGVTNNADQSVPTTIVSYTAGYEQAALEVARAIGIDRGSVQAADANTAAAADANVVVTVGSDQIG
jgi:hypothetical protein